jgi:antitoxin component YwqK of YwqJK toxin-antitoxin module
MGSYTMGVQSGWWKEFSDGGQLKEEGDYFNGKKTGVWKVYDTKGQFLKNINY